MADFVDPDGTQDAASIRGPIGWMARNTVAANLLMVVAIAAGIIGLLRVKQEVFPEFSLDAVTVQVVYPGASPAEVEQGILLAVEEAVRGLDGIKRVTASADEGRGTVTAELLLGANGEKVLADIKSAVDGIHSIPEDAERPLVAMAQPRRPVISLIVAGQQDLRVLHEIAEQARSELLRLPEVTQVELQGVRPLEVAIEIPSERLEAYGLTLQEVAQQIRASSLELPGGELETRGGELLVRVSDRRHSADEFAEIVVRGTAEGYTVRLGDIASIRDGYADTDQASFFQGDPAIRVTAFRVGEETPTGVARAVKEYAAKLEQRLPEEITLAIWSDRSKVLEQRMDLLTRNARLGIILVVLVLALLLEVRLAGWVALGIPISFLGAMAVLPALGGSINMITLFAFIVTLGMVVDDAIVVGENIHTLMQAGVPRLQAAIMGARSMAMPVTFSILTTIAAFSPLFFVPGVMGKVFKLIPVVVVAVLFVSLLESFFVLPAHLSHHGKWQWLNRALSPFEAVQRRAAGLLEVYTQRVFRPSLLAAVRHRYLTVAVAVGTLIVTLSLVGSGIVPFRFFPKLEGDVVVAGAELPYGAPVERTQAVQQALQAAARRAIDALGGDAILVGIFTRMGQGASAGGHSTRGRSTGSHLVTVEANLVASSDREVTSAQVAAEWKKQMPPIPGIRSLVFNHSTGPGAGSAVDVQLSHRNVEVLARASEQVTKALHSFGDLTNVENSYAAGKPQLNFKLLPEAKTLGVTSNQVARQLRSAFFGAEALREQRGRNEVRVMVRLPEQQRRSEQSLEEFLIRTPTGGHVPLSYVAKVERGRAPTVIRRENGQRIVNVTADLATGIASPRVVLNSMKADVFPSLRAMYPELDVGMVGQQREQAEAFKALGKNYLLALLVVFALLAIPFRSYVQPLIIMSAIPLGFVGAIWGHLLMGYSMSIISLFGVVALSGVVVNDSLVLVDAINRRRREGNGALEATIAGAVRRFRPILLTSLTTFFGLAPMILETSIQARFLIPMAISLGFGVMFATVVLLMVVPCLYLILEDIKLRLFGSGAGAQERRQKLAA